MNTDNINQLKAHANLLMEKAEALGMVLTIETLPRYPLAMGNHDMLVDVRPKYLRPLEWGDLWEAMKAAPEAWIETTEKMYWYCLECVPPRRQWHDRFLVGEPSRHNDEGAEVHTCFKQVGDKFFAKDMTVNTYLSELVHKTGGAA